MTDILQKIGQHKIIEVAQARAAVDTHTMRQRALCAPEPRDFVGTILAKHQQGFNAIIAEVKKASPSKGVIREDFHPVVHAKDYEQGGAACLSVLTDGPFFQGKHEYLTQARAAVSLPVLCKDFMVDEYQILMARAAGADAVLLIAALLDETQLQHLEQVAHDLGMAVLLELHEVAELSKCTRLRTRLRGVNNRNLRTFEVDLAQTQQLLPHLSESIVVAESGIATKDDIDVLKACGVQTFLVGETLMRADDTVSAVQSLL